MEYGKKEIIGDIETMQKQISRIGQDLDLMKTLLEGERGC